MPAAPSGATVEAELDGSLASQTHAGESKGLEVEVPMISRRVAIAMIAILSMPMAAARADVSSDPVIEWNAIMATTTSGQNPFAQARLAAVTQLAGFGAGHAVTPDYAPPPGTRA